jgi:hypothetical protein
MLNVITASERSQRREILTEITNVRRPDSVAEHRIEATKSFARMLKVITVSEKSQRREYTYQNKNVRRPDVVGAKRAAAGAHRGDAREGIEC